MAAALRWQENYIIIIRIPDVGSSIGIFDSLRWAQRDEAADPRESLLGKLIINGFHSAPDNELNFKGNLIFQTSGNNFIIYDQDQKVGDFYELLSDPVKSMKIEIVNSFYKKSYYAQQDADIFLVQTLISFQDNYIAKLSSGVFQLDLKQIYFQHSEQNYRAKYYDLLNLLNDITSDYICFANCISIEQNQELNTILKFVLVNAFKISKVKDLLSLKGVLFDKILNYELNIEQIVEQVSERISNDSCILRLKEEFQTHFDPFIFHKYTRLTQDLFEQLKQKKVQELIIGEGQRDYQIGGFECILLTKVFSDLELIRLLLINIKIDSFTLCQNSKDLDVFKMTLRLLGVFLKFSIKMLQNGSTVQHLEFIIKSENEKKLNELMNFKNLQDLKPTIQLILKFFKEIQILLKDDKILFQQQTESVKINQQDKYMKRKQDKLKKQFLEKQNKFQKENEQLLLQQQQEITNKELCLYCREGLNFQELAKKQYFGIYGFISRDNISQHCRYFLNQQEYSKVRRKYSSEGTHDNDFQSYSISSCNHFVHHSCDGKNKKKQKNKKHIFSSPLEMLCGHCYFLSNIFVYVIDELVQPQQCQMEIEIPQIEDTGEEALQLLFSERKKLKAAYSPELKKLTHTFFDSIMQQLLQEEEIMTGDIKCKGDDWLLMTMIQLISNLVNSIQLSGLHFYARKDLRLYQNIYYHVKIYFADYIEHNPAYFKQLQQTLLEDIRNIQVYINGGLFENKSFQTLAHLEFKFFQQIILLFIIDEYYNTNQLINKLISEYTRFLVALQFIQYVGKQEPQQIQSHLAQFGVKGKLAIEKQYHQQEVTTEVTYDLETFELFMQNEDFKSELIFYLLPIYRKCVGIFATFNNLPTLAAIDPTNCSSDIEEIDGYLAFLGNICGKGLTVLEPLKALLQKQTLQYDGVQLLRSLSKTTFSQFTLSPLPDNYHDFLLEHIIVQCSYCNEICSNASPFLCLICDRVICSVKCNSSESKGQGNLCRHALSNHSGKCAFVHLYTGLVILNYNMKMIKFAHLYRDSFGQLPNTKKYQFKKFQLDRKVHNKISDIIINNRIPQEVTYIIMKDENVLFTTGFM